MSISVLDRHTLPKLATIAAVALCVPLAAGGALAQGYPDPSQRLDWTIAFGPGGGNDIMARTMIEILDKHDLYPGDIVAENRQGGSGAVGWGYLYNQAGNPYAISTTSGSYITTPLQADTPWGPTSFTPIALLATDDLLLLVNGDSEIDNLEAFIEQAKADPPTIGGIGAVNVDFIVPTLLADKAGFEFEYVSFNAEGELITGLLSNALDAIVSMPRGLILAPDAPAEAQAWWIETMKKVVETPEWQEYIESNNLTENIRYGEEFRTFLAQTSDTFA